MFIEAVVLVGQKIGSIEKVKVPGNQMFTFPVAILPHSRRHIIYLSEVYVSLYTKLSFNHHIRWHKLVFSNQNYQNVPMVSTSLDSIAPLIGGAPFFRGAPF